MDSSIRSRLTTSITWEPFASRTGRGVASYGAPTTLYCFIEGFTQMIRSKVGEEVASTWTLYLDNSNVASMTEEDRLTLPSGEQPPIIRISPVWNEQNNIDHYEVYL